MGSRVRPRVGFFSLDVANSFNELLLRGVEDGAREAGVDLLVVHGGQLESPNETEKSRNILYDRLDRSWFDGLLLADLFAFVGDQRKAEFLQGFQGIPWMTIGHRMTGCPGVLVDNAPGFRALILQLLDQGCQQFAVITGPPFNLDSQQRMACLKETLESWGVRLTPEMVYEGTYSWASGRAGARSLLQRFRGQFQVLVCFNDNMALAAMEELKSQGVEIPDDVMVTGFDNTEEGQFMSPSLTSVSFPIYQMGKQGIRLLAAQIRQEEVPGETVLESRPLFRRSTRSWEGINEWDRELPGDLMRLMPPEGVKLGDFSDFVPGGVLAKTLAQIYSQEARGNITDFHLDHIRNLLGTFTWQALQALKTHHSSPLYDSLQNQLDALKTYGWDLKPWSYLLELLGRVLYQKLPGEFRPGVATLFSQAVFLAKNAYRLSRLAEDMQERMRSERLADLGQTLITALDEGRIRRYLETWLPQLQIPQHQLTLVNENPRGTWTLDEGFLRENPWVFLDWLHLQETPLGFIVYPLCPRPGLLFNTLRHLISSSLHATQLFHQVQQSNEDLEVLVSARTRELEDANRRLQEEMVRRKKVEQDLLRQKNLESLGLLAGGLAHDFNNLLTGILGNVSLMEMGTLNPEESKYCISDILRAVDRAKALTQQLLTFSQGGAPVLHPLFLPPRVEEWVRFSLRGSGVQTSFQWPEDLWDVDADASQISQVISNLAINASQAMGDQGSLWIQAYHHQETSNRPTLHAGDYVVLEVRDSGPGFTQDTLEKLFTPYFTTKAQGTGLGLATSLTILRRHRGFMEADNHPEGGAVFRLYLPKSQIQRDSANSPGAPEGPAPEELPALNILALDDQRGILEILSRMLGPLGHRVVKATTGEEAWNLWLQAVDQGEPFDLLIFDLVVPGGPGGEEILKRVRQTGAQVKALASSGYSDSAVMARPQEFGFHGTLKKPYTLAELQKALIQVFHG